jgi:hypothetical protein
MGYEKVVQSTNNFSKFYLKWSKKLEKYGTPNLAKFLHADGSYIFACLDPRHQQA